MANNWVDESLRNNTSILFNLAFANNTILLCFSILFLIIDLYFLIPAVIAQIFNPNAELVIPTNSSLIPSREAKADIEIYPVFVEPKIRKCLI